MQPPVLHDFCNVFAIQVTLESGSNVLQRGASPRGLIGEIGALLSSAFVDQLVKGTLENVRAFISHHNDVLHDPSRWPVLYFVEQLASQETDNTFQSAPAGAQANGHLEKKVGSGAFIQRVNPRQERRAYRWIMQGDDSVNVVAFSPDGSIVARIEGTLVVVCDTTTGFMECTLTGHSDRYILFMNTQRKITKNHVAVLSACEINHSKR